ncbi:hypothetical protein COS74_03950 [bacterium CG06_land_8_20_14_3_00_33_50]|nr:MAG: hypothetical protein COS74_03950 [bacterium CG06_land_8_20_14_3_00_33_50]PJA71775.1 MAG: hypothetical protein CO152_04970 [bacterium CG_4_9_14_3_um_filter_33_26]
MKRIRILALIPILAITGLVNQVEAYEQSFEIPVQNNKPITKSVARKINNEKKAGIKIEIKKPQLVKINNNPADARKESDRKKLVTNGFKDDYYDTYIKAADAYSLDWRILAAVHKIESGQRGDTLVKSCKGATGPMQFMPSTFRAYAVDGNNDGVANINSVEDSIFTASHYLSRNNATNNIDQALYRYNHSTKYVNQVKSLIYSIK